MVDRFLHGMGDQHDGLASVASTLSSRFCMFAHVWAPSAAASGLIAVDRELVIL
jgi:hypothetical protein